MLSVMRAPRISSENALLINLLLVVCQPDTIQKLLAAQSKAWRERNSNLLYALSCSDGWCRLTSDLGCVSLKRTVEDTRPENALSNPGYSAGISRLT
jgi:hypothetical protein